MTLRTQLSGGLKLVQNNKLFLIQMKKFGWHSIFKNPHEEVQYRSVWVLCALQEINSLIYNYKKGTLLFLE